MTYRARASVVLAALASVAIVASADIRVTPLVADGQVFASFAAPSAVTEDARAVMRSGLQLTFTFAVELRRPATVWWDATLAEVIVASSVKYDNLTGVYQISKLQGGRVVWSERTKDEAQLRTWMTTFERVPVQPAAPLEPNGDYYVRVRLHASPKRTFSLWPWGRDDGSGRADFTFIR
jgi:hypothetical protein